MHMYNSQPCSKCAGAINLYVNFIPWTVWIGHCNPSRTLVTFHATKIHRSIRARPAERRRAVAPCTVGGGAPITADISGGRAEEIIGGGCEARPTLTFRWVTSAEAAFPVYGFVGDIPCKVVGWTSNTNKVSMERFSCYESIEMSIHFCWWILFYMFIAQANMHYWSLI